MILEKIPKTYSINEVAAALNIDRQTIVNMGKRKTIEVVKVGGQLRVLESSLENYLKEIGLYQEEKA